MLNIEIPTFICEKDKLFNECHAVSAVELPSGNFIACWFAGTKEGNSDVDIWIARQINKIWQPPRKLIANEDALWNPVLFYDDDTLTLFYRQGVTIGEWKTLMRTSKDEGETFSEAQKLPDGFMGPIKNKPIKMSNGQWLCGGSIEPEWECLMEVYSPATNTWECSVKLQVPGSDMNSGIIQPTLWESFPGHIHALMRSSLESIYRSDSSDFGKTWCSPYKIDLPSNNSGIDLVKTPAGELILAYNPIAENWGKRSPLILSLSEDNGKTWPCHYTLEEEEDFDPEDRYRGRYSYPAIINSQNGVTCFYTYNRKQIRYQTIPVEAIRNYQSRAVS